MPGQTRDEAATWCPPRMSDGRAFTQYLRHCYPTTETSNERRRRLVTNASADIAENARLAATEHCAPGFATKCYDVKESGTMAPELGYMLCDRRTCAYIPGTAGGIGTGRRSFR